MDAVKPAEGLSDLIGSGCSIREAITLHPAGGGFRNKHEIKELSFPLGGDPLGFSLASALRTYFVMTDVPAPLGILAKRVALP